jgi:MFS family permease
MHGESFTSAKPLDKIGDKRPWFLLLTGYHWFVLVVAALGWLFDTMDQQLFNLARAPAITQLTNGKDVAWFSGFTTSIFLIGWATGGIVCGILGDRIGRAKTMLLTILLYSLFTGLSALSQTVYDFALYRFLTGLGVGGEFAVGVALVAETVPDRARTGALGMLQALSAIGNVMAALISIVLGRLEETGAIGSAWRVMFVIGTLPALLSLVIFRRLKEPERWKAAVAGPAALPKDDAHWQPPTSRAVTPPAPTEMTPPLPPAAAPLEAEVRPPEAPRPRGSLVGMFLASISSLIELFADPRWRKNAIVGVLLASAGVIGLWGIGFFSFDLNRTVFRKVFQREALAAQGGTDEDDRIYVRNVMHQMERGEYKPGSVKPEDLIDPHARALYQSALRVHAEHLAQPIEAFPQTPPEVVPASEVLAALDAQGQSAADRAARQAILSAEPPGEAEAKAAGDAVAKRTKEIAGRLTFWAGVTSLMLNLGAFFGIYGFSVLAQITGRRPAFAVAFLLAGVSTALTFWYIDRLSDVFWMIPIMGFCQLSLFGGYAIYFPELFPTRLRSTGTSFCYNVGRYVAAVGPSALGLLTDYVYKGYPEPMRYAGVTMCAVFVLGLVALPFAPETKGQPLPE